MTPVKFLPAILLCLLPLAAQAETPEEKGLAIAVEADNRDTGFVDHTNNVQMILRNKHGQESTRVIRSKTLEVEGDGDKSQTIFDEPPVSQAGEIRPHGYGKNGLGLYNWIPASAGMTGTFRRVTRTELFSNPL